MMSSDKIKVKGLTDVRLRSDGQEVILIFETAQRTKLTLVVPGFEMTNLARQMMHFSRQAQIKRTIPPDADRATPPSIEAPPPIFFVSEMEGVVMPERGALDLQLRDIAKHEIQVCLLPAQTAYLFEMLLTMQTLEDGQKPN